MVEPARISRLNGQHERPERSHVIYWMEASQRTIDNHALEYAIERANELRLPLHVIFIIPVNDPGATARNHAFMIDGLRDVDDGLRRRGTRLSILRCDPDRIIHRLASDAACLVLDRGYLRHQTLRYTSLASTLDIRVWQVESNVVVPVDVVSMKEEYAARTIRPKLERLVDDYLTLPPPIDLIHPTTERLADDEIDVSTISVGALNGIDHSVRMVEGECGGEIEALKRLDRFRQSSLSHYAIMRNDPTSGVTSGLSPYLHFGQISPIRVAISVIASADGVDENIETFLDELIVRRELAMNLVSRNERYDSFASLPSWARQTLDEQRHDHRDHIYSLEQLDAAETHDRFWNAAMIEMRETGRMAGYMRMYWGKKLIEWTAAPEEAYDTLSWLNDRYFLDGRDPVSYANIAWIFGKHDRPWTRRPIFGTVRYMNAAGLKRKFPIDEYAARMEAIDSR